MSSEGKVDRRTFLKTTAAATAGGTLITIGISAPGCGNSVTAAPITDVTVADSPSASGATISENMLGGTYGVIQVPWTIFKDLMPVGGAITLKLPASIAGSDTTGHVVPPDNTVLLVHRATDEFIAVQSSCPHAGCPLGYSAKQGKIECPCHASQFFADPADNVNCVGAVAHLPAQAPLQTFKTSLSMIMVGAGGVLPFVSIDLKESAACGSQPTVPPVVNGMVTFPFADFPQLMTAGGSVSGQPMGATAPLVVVRVSATEAAALNARCTHRGCTVNWAPQAMELECPCHGSAFALDGRVKSPPASTPLKSYPVALNADSIVVTIN